MKSHIAVIGIFNSDLSVRVRDLIIHLFAYNVWLDNLNVGREGGVESGSATSVAILEPLSHRNEASLVRLDNISHQ